MKHLITLLIGFIVGNIFGRWIREQIKEKQND